jgi:CRP-like cAMP-binding protein
MFEEEIDYIVSRAKILIFEKDKFVVREGDEGAELYILLRGHAEVVKVVDHEPVVLNKLEKGDVFGEMVIINENTRTADIITTDKCEILCLDYQDIFKLYEKKPKLFALLSFNLSRLLVKRIKGFSSTIIDVSTNSKKAS